MIRLTNNYFIDGDTTYIKIKRKNGQTYTAMIDTEDLAKVSKFTWYLVGCSRKLYVGTVKRYGKKKKTIRLHRYIVGEIPEGKFIDHIDGNPLNNKKSNLRIVSNSENQQNLSPQIFRNTLSGIRGVTWNKQHKKWQAQVKIHGKKFNLGYFDDKFEAGNCVSEFRRRHMPFSEMDKKVVGLEEPNHDA